MKNVQVISAADETRYPIYAVTDEEFCQIFPDKRQNVEFAENMFRRIGNRKAALLLKATREREVEKSEIFGIHGTLFCGLIFKQKYFPSKNDTEMVVLL